ncbi:AAA family ATPase [Paenibacillus frigoriresistens]|nr:AAA family ATPase [Paenibacillus frigoriresistens]
MSSNGTYRHLNGNPIDDQELKLRLSAIKKIVVHHHRFKQLHEMIHNAHFLHEGVVILGDTGAGKTTLFKTYEAKFPRVQKVRMKNNFEVRYKSIPVLRVELDSNSSPLNVASKCWNEWEMQLTTEEQKNKKRLDLKQILLIQK